MWLYDYKVNFRVICLVLLKTAVPTCANSELSIGHRHNWTFGSSAGDKNCPAREKWLLLLFRFLVLWGGREAKVFA